MFLSMIIPVYNTEKYLEECLNSCLAQDLPCTDYEIICVNDGSKDRSHEILCQYRSRHESIIVIDQPNAGVSAARNAGLKIAQGSYVWFIDADDFIRENCLKRLQDRVNETGCDRLTFSNLYFFTDNLSDRERQQLADGTLLTNGTRGDGVIWSSIYRRSLLAEHQVRFRDGVAYGEDLIFMYEWNRIPHTKSAISDLIYLQRQHGDSAVSNVHSRRSVDSDFIGASVMKTYFLEESAKGTPCTEICHGFSHFVKCAMQTLAYADRETWNRERRRFIDAGLFPIRMPRGYKPYRTPVSAKRSIFGAIIDHLYEIAYTVRGARMLRFYCQFRQFLYSLLRKKTQNN